MLAPDTSRRMSGVSCDQSSLTKSVMELSLPPAIEESSPDEPFDEVCSAARTAPRWLSDGDELELEEWLALRKQRDARNEHHEAEPSL